MTGTTNAAGPSRRAMEAWVALAIMGFGGLGIVGSLQVGVGWGAEGPRSGFFPFYVGMAVVLAGLVNLIRARGVGAPGRLFAEWGHLRRVFAVIVPTALYVAAIPWLGLYVCSIVLIAGFMLALGKYHPATAIGLAVGLIVGTFAVFEWWFLVPLPKGPIEDLLGL